MALITLSEFRAYLQISDSAYDTLYDVYINSVSEDVMNMANQYFNLTYSVTTTENSPILSSSVLQYDVFEGMTVSGIGIPDRSIVQDTSVYETTLNKYCTASGTIAATFNAVPEQIKPVIAQMLLYKINTSKVVNGGEVKDLKSKGIGPVSVSYGDGAAIDSTWGYPRNLVKSIKRIKRVKIDIGKTRRRGQDITNVEDKLYYR